MSKMPIFRMLATDLKEVQIAYTISGETNTETILFVHGLGANASQFNEQHAYFSEKFKVISIDLRGHGNSKAIDKSNNFEPTLQKMAEDVIGLLHSLNIRNVHFVGNSMGGNVGYELLRTASELIKSFTTFGTTAQMKTSKFRIGLLRIFYKALPLKVLAVLSKSAGQTANSKDRIEKMLLKANKKTIVTLMPHLANFDYLKVIEKTTMPAMILKGERDKEINKVLGTTLAKFEKRSDFYMVVMKNAGHFANLDDPAIFHTILENFILKVNSR